MRLRSLSATETETETTTDIFARAQKALPQCYTPELDACFVENGEASPFCDVMNKAYDTDYDRMQAMLDEMPVCPAPDPNANLKLAGVGVLGLAVGVLVSRALK
jgi:hypothetical protein